MRNLVRISIAAALAVSLGFVWTVGQSGLKQANRNLCELWASLPLPPYKSCEFQNVLVYVWLALALLGAAWIAVELWMRRKKLQKHIVGFFQMIEPIHLIIFGLAVAAIGVGWQMTKVLAPPEPTQQQKDAITAPFRTEIENLKRQIASQPPQPQQPAFFGGGPTTEPPNQRRYTNRTVRELRALYEGKTAFQADKLIEPYKGMWIETEGKIVGIYADSNGGAVAALRNNDDPIECRFSSDRAKDLGRYNDGEMLRVRGKLSTSQNGQQIYLIYCEVVEGTGDQAGDDRPIDLYTGKKIAVATPATPPQTKNYFGPEKVELGALLSKISDQLNGDALIAAQQGYRYANSSMPTSSAELTTLMHQVEGTIALVQSAWNQIWAETVDKSPKFQRELIQVVGPKETPNPNAMTPINKFRLSLDTFQRDLSILVQRIDVIPEQDRAWIILNGVKRTADDVHYKSNDFQAWINECNGRIDNMREALR